MAISVNRSVELYFRIDSPDVCSAIVRQHITSIARIYNRFDIVNNSQFTTYLQNEFPPTYIINSGRNQRKVFDFIDVEVREEINFSVLFKIGSFV